MDFGLITTNEDQYLSGLANKIEEYNKVIAEESETVIPNINDSNVNSSNKVIGESVNTGVNTHNNIDNSKNTDVTQANLDVEAENINEGNITEPDYVNQNVLEAFKVLETLNFLKLPEKENYTDEDINNSIAEFEERVFANSIDIVVGDDPYMKELIQYSLNGGKYADLIKFQNVLKQQIDYDDFDANNETESERLLRNELYEKGLDADAIDATILAYKDKDLLKTKAQDIITFKKEKLELLKKQENENVIKLNEQAELESKKQQLAIQKFNTEFETSLKRKNWSPETRKLVEQDLKMIKVKDGDNEVEVPAFIHKENIIKNNPELFAEFLKLLTNFDIEKRAFTSNVTQVVEPKKLISKVVQQLNNNISKKVAASNTQQNSQKTYSSNMVHIPPKGTNY